MVERVAVVVVAEKEVAAVVAEAAKAVVAAKVPAHLEAGRALPATLLVAVAAMPHRQSNLFTSNR